MLLLLFARQRAAIPPVIVVPAEPVPIPGHGPLSLFPREYATQLAFARQTADAAIDAARASNTSTARRPTTRADTDAAFARAGRVTSKIPRQT